MRTAFAEALQELARADERIYLLIGDVGFGVFEPFTTEFGRRFVNSGVSEANMTATAAGLALSGKVPFTYSIGNFPTIRCLEQVRNDVCYHAANVKIVCVGGGLAYGALGATHHATEDLAIMRALPNMTVVAPADPFEARLATQAAAAMIGPVYIRLNRAGDKAVYSATPEFTIGKANLLRSGSDATIIATGAMVLLALEAAEALARIRISCRVLSMHTIKPLDVDAVRRAADETVTIFTLEEHSLIGGLGGAVAEVLAEMPGPRATLKRLALPDAFTHRVGSQDYLRAAAGLSVDGIVRDITASLAGSARAVAAAL